LGCTGESSVYLHQRKAQTAVLNAWSKQNKSFHFIFIQMRALGLPGALSSLA
jgi:hypothetical protein